MIARMTAPMNAVRAAETWYGMAVIRNRASAMADRISETIGSVPICQAISGLKK
jgi:hypothetical protein